MTLRQFLKTIGSCAVLAVLVLVGMSITSRRGQANSDDTRGQAYGDDNGGKDEASKIKRGFEIPPSG